MDIKKFSEEIHKNALEKGFWDEEKDIPRRLLLIHSEVSEACEADRKNNYAKIEDFKDRCKTVLESMINSTVEEKDRAYKKLYETYIKDSFGAEIAGTIIRCFDLCKFLNMDIESHLEAEHKYNTLRPYKHGKKY